MSWRSSRASEEKLLLCCVVDKSDCVCVVIIGKLHIKIKNNHKCLNSYSRSFDEAKVATRRLSATKRRAAPEMPALVPPRLAHSL